MLVTALLAALPLRALADIPAPGPRPPRPDYPQPTLGPEPRPSSGPCSGKAAGDDCEIPESSVDAPTMVGSRQTDSGSAADSAAHRDIAAADFEPAQRLWMTMLLGVLALGGGVTLVYRNARMRRG
jgi:hypothetical protein